MRAAKAVDAYGPWNPGILSELPREYLPLSTMFRDANVTTSVEQAEELSDFCGLKPQALVAFRAERLIVHELLVRVTADLAVPDGTSYEDLGINFRQIASTILDTYIAPNRNHLIDLLNTVRSQAAAIIETALADELFAPQSHSTTAAPPAPFWKRLLPGIEKPEPASPSESVEDREARVVADWLETSQSAQDELVRACHDALVKVAAAVSSKRGRLIGDKQLIAGLAVTMVCNDYGSAAIGQAINPYIQQAVEAEGYRLLPPQERPVVLNVKGASAAGKSTMRPMQRKLVETLDIPWEDFALISPDIWRKFLLNYDTLGDAVKYAGTMTGHELEIIDKKLDRYMAKKGGGGKMSHLLIDRFRFDSFVPKTDADESSKLLTRFGDLVYMYFMITPPEATVERAWKRGLKFGRYKAVDDLLDHNVEAYTGMPQLFFTWALRTQKRVHYEFLDNSVKEGCRPRTVAFGWNGEMNILSIKSMIDIDRFRKVNIDARCPQEVYDKNKLAAQTNVDFLQQCARLIPAINFADFETGQIYARLESGKWAWRDEVGFAKAIEDADTRIGLEAIGSDDYEAGLEKVAKPADLVGDKTHTLGAWGPGAGAGQ